jgi:hypothetical protein
MQQSALQRSEKFHLGQDCSGLVVVQVKSGTLHIELACRCGWTHHYCQTLEEGVSVELDGHALLLEKFSHRPLRSRGSAIPGALSC